MTGIFLVESLLLHWFLRQYVNDVIPKDLEDLDR